MFSWGRLILRGSGPLAALFASLLLLLFGVSPAAGEQPHAFTVPFGSPGSGAGQFDLASESSLAIDQSNGDLYVADTGNHRVEKFDPTGAFLFAFGWGVKMGDTSSTGLDTCTTVTGCQAGFPGYEPGQFEEPTFIAVDNTPPEGNGDVYVANDGAVGNELQKIELSGAGGGEYTLSFTDIIHGTTTNGSKLLTGAWGPTVYLKAGEAISGPGIPPGTTIRGGVETVELSANATASGSAAFEVTSTTAKVAYNATREQLQGALEKLEVLEGNILVSGSSGGPYTIEFTGRLAGVDVRQVACDGSGLTPGGAVCIAATIVDGFNASRVQKFDSSGSLIAGWGGSPAGGELDGTACSECGYRPHFEHPSGVAVIPPVPKLLVKPEGSLLVLDRKKATEWKQSSGEFVYSPGTPPNDQPTGIAVDPADRVYLGTGGVFAHPPYKIIQAFYCDKEDPFGLCPPKNAGEGFAYHENFTVDPGPDTSVAVEPLTEDAYVARFNPFSHQSDVASYDSSGKPLESSFGGHGEIVQSAGVAASGFSGSQGDVYVADMGANRVEIFAPGGPQGLLTVIRAGSGLGTVSSVPAGISCPSLCSTGFPKGEVVTLTATAPEHSSFLGWSGGDCAGTGVCQIALAAATVLTATFAHATPVLSTLPVSTVTRHTATLMGQVDPEGDASSCRFEYGLTNGYGAEVPCASHPGSGVNPVTVNAELWDLAAGTTYHYRLVSANSGGSVYGSDGIFTTLSEGCASNLALCPPQSVEPSFTNEGLVFKLPGGGTPTHLTNAQKLARALRACRRGRKKSVRVSCERQARKRYPLAKKIKKSTHSGKRG